LTDPAEGLAKVMDDLSVEEIELGTLTSQLKNKSAKVEKLEEQAKSREVLLSKLNANKYEALKELKKL
jgi:hypothetical protein